MQKVQEELLLHFKKTTVAASTRALEMSQMESRLDVLRCKLHEEEERRVQEVGEKQDEIERLVLAQQGASASEVANVEQMRRCLILAHGRIIKIARRDVLRSVWQLLMLWVGVRRQLRSNLSYAELMERQRDFVLTWEGTMVPERSVRLRVHWNTNVIFCLPR
jgi:hypothetical protein